MKAIPEYLGRYSATEDGRIYSHISGRFIRAHKRTGYLGVSLRRNGKTFNHTVHSLIALTFLGPRNGREVDHKNRIWNDNRASNLRYVTRGFNLHNCEKRNKAASRFKGIYKAGSGWAARIKFNQGNRYLGLFRNEVDAATAYDNAVKKIYGGNAVTNKTLGAYEA